MATATIDVSARNVPPTEAEIRDAIQSRDDGPADAGATVYEITAPAVALWDDLRPSEAARLEELMEKVYALADEFEARVTEAVVAAASQFAAEHPDAPRAKAGQIA